MFLQLYLVLPRKRLKLSNSVISISINSRCMIV
nr:MAG TPA: hypothetical protein [Caudoviricetes sp.]